MKVRELFLTITFTLTDKPSQPVVNKAVAFSPIEVLRKFLEFNLSFH
jgi:hypothetical protein